MQHEPSHMTVVLAECQKLEQRLASFGLGFQPPAIAVLELALIRLLTSKGLCTEADWQESKAEVTRDLLAEAVAHAPQIKAQYAAEARKPQLAVPPHVQRN